MDFQVSDCPVNDKVQSIVEDTKYYVFIVVEYILLAICQSNSMTH